MVRSVSFWALRPGVDPEALYAYWRDKHTAWAKKLLLPELRKYTINRVVNRFGDNNIYGFSEVWFDDVESAQRAMGRLVKAKEDDMLAKMITPPIRLLVEVEEVPLK